MHGFVAGELAFLSPDAIYAELGYTLRKHVLRGNFTANRGHAFIDQFVALGIPTVGIGSLSSQAARLTTDYTANFYDALYIALAIREDLKVVTADEPMTPRLRQAGPHAVPRRLSKDLSRRRWRCPRARPNAAGRRHRVEAPLVLARAPARPLQILRSRLERIPPRERPHYTPERRFQILEHMKAFLLGVEDAARRFLVTEQTLYNWLHELRRNPDARTIGSLLKPTPPIRRYHNLVRRRARQMKAFGFQGNGEIALIERFWKSLKGDLRLSLMRPWGRADFEKRLLGALVRYSFCRPHSALRGRVPVEVYFGIKDQRPLRNLAPRGRPGDPEIDCPFETVCLDPDSETLPILLPKAA